MGATMGCETDKVRGMMSSCGCAKNSNTVEYNANTQRRNQNSISSQSAQYNPALQTNYSNQQYMITQPMLQNRHSGQFYPTQNNQQYVISPTQQGMSGMQSPPQQPMLHIQYSNGGMTMQQIQQQQQMQQQVITPQGTQGTQGTQSPQSVQSPIAEPAAADNLNNASIHSAHSAHSAHSQGSRGSRDSRGSQGSGGQGGKKKEKKIIRIDPRLSGGVELPHIIANEGDNYDSDASHDKDASEYDTDTADAIEAPQVSRQSVFEMQQQMQAMAAQNAAASRGATAMGAYGGGGGGAATRAGGYPGAYGGGRIGGGGYPGAYGAAAAYGSYNPNQNRMVMQQAATQPQSQQQPESTQS